MYFSTWMLNSQIEAHMSENPNFLRQFLWASAEMIPRKPQYLVDSVKLRLMYTPKSCNDEQAKKIDVIQFYFPYYDIFYSSYL